MTADHDQADQDPELLPFCDSCGCFAVPEPGSRDCPDCGDPVSWI